MRRPRLTPLLACTAVAAAFLAAAPASLASSGQATIMQDDTLVLYSGAATRQRALEDMKALGARIVKVQVYWDQVAPGGTSKPAGFDAANPASAGYNWSAYDDVDRRAAALGLRVFFALGGRAPRWATARLTGHAGTYRPNPSEFELFARAAGTRYSGAFGGLPRVSLWSLWNEPNLSSWLAPQRGRRGVPLSPTIYRRLYLAGHNGLAATGHGSDRILLGELMPLGARSASKVPPLAFLRELFCLDSHYRAYRGAAARARGCPRRVGRIPTSGLAYHPYTARGGPLALPRSRDDAAIGQLSRITRTLDRLARRGKLARHLPIWITEYGFQTNPPDPFAYPIRKVPGFMDRSEWIAFHNRRVLSYSQYTLYDDPLGPGRGFQRYAGFQQGLRFADGRMKPGVYSAFQLPAFVKLGRRGRVEVFGGLRFGAPGTLVTISSSGRVLGHDRLNSAGYFDRVLRVGNAARRSYRITIQGLSRVKRPSSR
jgi:hypothetical protein